jgi:hypothetical protein
VSEHGLTLFLDAASALYRLSNSCLEEQCLRRLTDTLAREPLMICIKFLSYVFLEADYTDAMAELSEQGALICVKALKSPRDR